MARLRLDTDNIWFTADTHFGHGNIIKYCGRPFRSIADEEAYAGNGGKWPDRYKISSDAVHAMNKVLVENINNCVGKDGVLLHLGDFSFRDAHLYLDKIVCPVHLISGNHDEESSNRLFDSVSDMAEVVVGKRRFILNHYAMALWNKSHRGSIHLYGHSHAGAEEMLNKAFPDRRSMDVGVDNAALLLGAYRPFSLKEVLNFTTKG